MSEQIWNCQISRDPQGNFQTSLHGLTVGEKFYLQCQRNTKSDQQSNNMDSLKDEHLEESIIIFLKGHQWPNYALKPLKVISADQNVLIEVVSYIPGNYSADQGLFLQAKDQVVELKGISWHVLSSLSDPKNKNQQQPVQIQPHPPHGFVKIPLPYLQMVVWGGILLTSLIFTILVIKKIKKRKNEFDDIENLKTLRSPIYEFYHKARQMEKRHLSLPTTLSDKEKMSSTVKDHTISHLRLFCRDLNQNFRKFLAVELNFPAHLWSSQRSFKYLKKKYFDPELLNRIQNMLYELDQVQLTKDNFSEEACRQNLSLCKDLANQIVAINKKDKHLLS